MGTECLSIFEFQPKLCVTILLELWQTLNISPNHKRKDSIFNIQEMIL